MAASTGARRRPFAGVPADATPYAVRMRDGVRLATDVYLPDRGRRHPVLLSRLPYDKAGDECFMPTIARWFTERGYAVVVQDVRGKIRSDGDLAPFRAEVADGYDTLDWVTAQSWCAGPVGMFGDSYFGWTQWAAAASGHPALRAISPRVSSADFGDIASRQGVFALEVCALWAFETWVDEALYDYEGQLDWSVRPLSSVVSTALGGRSPVFLPDAAAGRLDGSARLPVRGDLPALHVGGWWDLAHRGQLSTWRQARAVGSAPQYLVMDTTDHGWTYLRDPAGPYVDPRSVPMDPFLDAYLGPLLPFFDRFLRDGTYDAAPVRWRLAHDGWRESDVWPPREARPVDWHLTRSGALAIAADRTAHAAGWTHDPRDPVPSLAHAYHPLIEPVDERGTVARDDVLAFETEPFGAPIDLAGPAQLSVRVTASTGTTHVIARVTDVAPDGYALRILDGAAVASAPWPSTVTVDLGHTGYRVRRGHRLRLELSSSEFPRYVLHPGTAADPWTATQVRTAEQQVVLGGADGAWLRCHVLGDGAR